MLRQRLVASLSLTILILWIPRTTSTTSALRLVTSTSEEVLNLNPSLSGDGRFIAFESTFDLASTGGNGFHAIRADIATEPARFEQMGKSRAVTPAISQDGSHIAFASADNPLGINNDGNSEIFLYRSPDLIQITNTTAEEDNTQRLSQGNFQPSISDDGRFIAFTSNRNLAEQNNDGNLEVFIFDTINLATTQLTRTSSLNATNAKISGDGNTIVYIAGNGTSRDLVLQRRQSQEPARVIAAGPASINMATGRTISDDGLRVVHAAEIASGATQVFLWDGRNNLLRQLTNLGTREDDVSLNATISGDGLRVSFATRRDVIGVNPDQSVELYILDLPSGQIESITAAPSDATAEVVSSLNDDGSQVAFSFPRVIVGSVSSNSLANNPEIFITPSTPRPIFGSLSVLNGATHGSEAARATSIAPGSIAVARGNALAYTTIEAARLADKSFPLTVAGTTVSVNGRKAQMFFVSPTEVQFVVPQSTEIGMADVRVTNLDGFQSRTDVSITPVAPGIFTMNGDGFGEGVILNADTLQSGPFDPGNGNLRLSIFATGIKDALRVSVTATGHPLTLESINPSPDLPGLDEIHVLVPATFQGAGKLDLAVRADNHVSNPAEVMFTGSAIRDVRINEVLADPPDGIAGDANHDGVRNSSEDEFLELVNTGSATNMSDWTIRTRALGGTNETVRHRFASGTLLFPGEVIVIFGGGNLEATNPIFGCTQVIEASTAGLSLTNGGLTIVIRDSSGGLVNEFTYGGTTGLDGGDNQSLTRSPDISGDFVHHASAAGANEHRFSAGLRTDGTPFGECTGQLTAIALSASSLRINIDEVTDIVARPLDNYGRPFRDVDVTFASDNPAIVTVNHVSLDEMTGNFTARITGQSEGLAHITVQAAAGETRVEATATVTVVSPLTPPLLVINQLYGGGNNSGATFQNDFVELFNRGTKTVDFSVTPFSLQYASAAGNFSNVNKVDLTTGSLAPGQYFLIRLAGGTTNGIPLPIADASAAAINLSAADGKVALVIGTDLLGGNGCPLGATIADFVGYGSANCAESAAVGSLGASRSARRVNNCGDTNSNATDFVVVTNPTPPRNSTTTPAPCL